MTLVVEEAYPNGVPQTAVEAFAPRGVGWHWSAGGTGRAGWEGTIRHLINTRYTVNASYHLGFWHEHHPPDCVTVAQWIVPATHAAHSLAPGLAFVPKVGSPVEHERFVDVHRILARDSDPNADILAPAFAGMPADLARDMACPVMQADVRQLARDLETSPAMADGPHFGHGWIQPSTRYEMDAPGLEFIAALAPVLDAPPPPPPPPTRAERLAAEALAFRIAHPTLAEKWHVWTGQRPNYAGPLEREMRTAAESIVGRLVEELIRRGATETEVMKAMARTGGS